jgi:transcriptional regulator with XRE-family HTH domain
MSRSNKLIDSPPYPVEQTITQLGENLRLARIRRNITIADAAERIGTGPRAVMDAERGKASTCIAVYSALLWLYDQLDQLYEVAQPYNDAEGVLLAAATQRKRVRRINDPDRDF